MLLKSDIKNFDRIYEILELSFPPDERRPYLEQAELFNDTRYSMLTATENGSIAAFMATWEFESFVFVEHFAAHPDFRNLGLGSRMLRELIEKTDKPICLEVEPPEGDITRRRIDFYKRNGFFLNSYSYMQPPISKGKNEIPLMIMTSGGQISETEFNTIKNTLYKEVYKI